MKIDGQKKMRGLCEAYEFYSNMLSEELQEKVPKDFVNEMKKCAKYNLGAKIRKLSDISADKISKEGLTYIKYINLCINDEVL